MKTSITNSKNSFLLLTLLLLPMVANAKLVGKVHSVKGESFAHIDGKTYRLVKDMDIADGAQLMVSDGAQVTIGDFYDRRFHLLGGSQFVMSDRSHVLQKGGLWSQAHASKASVSITTTNLLMNAYQAEYIVTYDPISKKGQLSVINGEVDVASPMQPAFRYALMAGQFTTAHPEVDEGYPRAPTKLGQDSLMKMIAQFPGIKSWDAGVAHVQTHKADRRVASVNESEPNKAGEIIYLKTYQSADRTPASAPDEAQKYFVKKSKKPVKRGTIAKVRVLGYQEVMKLSSRNPASSRKTQSKEPQTGVKHSEFLKSYELHHQKQPMHSKEVQRLIDDLKSY
jgi:hypothetical protein